MKTDEQIAENFFSRKGIEPRRFPKHYVGKAADFRLFATGSPFGFSEVKSILKEVFAGYRRDPTFNKIQSKIHEAAEQFDRCNPIHELPNILFFVNHDPHIGPQDLWLVLTGRYEPPGYSPSVFNPVYLNRLIKNDDLHIIDYIVWFDLEEQRAFYAPNQNSSFATSLTLRVSSKQFEVIPGLMPATISIADSAKPCRLV